MGSRSPPRHLLSGGPCSIYICSIFSLLSICLKARNTKGGWDLGTLLKNTPLLFPFGKPKKFKYLDSFLKTFTFHTKKQFICSLVAWHLSQRVTLEGSPVSWPNSQPGFHSLPPNHPPSLIGKKIAFSLSTSMLWAFWCNMTAVLHPGGCYILVVAEVSFSINVKCALSFQKSTI